MTFKTKFITKYLLILLAAAAALTAASSYIMPAVLIMMILGVLIRGRTFGNVAGESEREIKHGVLLELLLHFTVCGFAVICIGIGAGLNKWCVILVGSLYIVCLIIRLTWLYERELDPKSRENRKKYYKGVPESAVTVLLPLVYACTAFSKTVFSVFYCVLLAALSVSFIFGVKIKKPNGKIMLAVNIASAVLIILIVVFSLTKLYAPELI